MSPGNAFPAQPARPVTREGLLLWVIHRFGDTFEQRFILKGGMSLRLLDSPRHTNDVDLILVPYDSKRAVLPEVEQVLAALEDATVRTTVHSRMIRVEVRLDGVGIQVEVAVARECASIPMATAALANTQGVPSQIVRIMAPSLALAHKLAAWNERRLMRDLYDLYFLFARLDATPDSDVLLGRLASFHSRLPALRRRRRMSLTELCDELRNAAETVSDEALHSELAGLIDVNELAGLALRIRVSLHRLLDTLREPVVR